MERGNKERKPLSRVSRVHVKKRAPRASARGQRMSGEPKPMGSDEDRASLIRAEVRNILASEVFRDSKRAGDFVELVVEHAPLRSDGRFQQLISSVGFPQ
jgi:hypothetical protein